MEGKREREKVKPNYHRAKAPLSLLSFFQEQVRFKNWPGLLKNVNVMKEKEGGKEIETGRERKGKERKGKKRRKSETRVMTINIVYDLSLDPELGRIKTNADITVQT